MTIEYEITPEEYALFSVHTITSTERYRQSMKRIRFVYGPLLVLAGGALLFWVDESRAQVYIGLFFLLIGFYFLFFHARSNFTQLLKNSSSAMEKEENRGFLQERKTEFLQSGVKAVTELEKTEVLWEAVLRVHETPQLFMLYNSGISAFIIPKRVLEGDQERQFRSILDERQLTVTYFEK